MTSYNTFYIDRTSGTHADELLVAGLVRLLRLSLRRQQGTPSSIQWQNKGPYYQLTSEIPLQPNLLDHNSPLPLAPFILTNKNSKTLPITSGTAIEIVRYDDEKEKNNQFWETFKSLEKTAKAHYMRGESNLTLKPPPDWDFLRMINPAALTGYNTLMNQWWHASKEDLPAHLQLVAELFAQTPNPTAAIEQKWKKLAKKHKWQGNPKATASQFFNPSQGKGINRAKATGTGLANVKNFWLLELLKIVGMFEAGFTKTLGSSGDRKTYVPVIGHMTDKTHQAIQKDFKGRMLFGETAVRSDILTILRYLKAFLNYSEQAYQQANSEDESFDQWLSWLAETPRPADFMHGFQMAYYKNMGNAVATMNVAFLNLPRWVIIHNETDITPYNNILDEHENIVRQFEEKRGEEITLLTAYRNFITADHLDPFLHFTALYSGYIINQRERAKFAYQFKEHNLRRLFMSSDPQRFSPILENQGFQNIAYAIRQSTIVAQLQKKEGDRRYDVRYGLGQELLRQSQYANQFLKAISEFIVKYNAESAQVMENRSGPYRTTIHKNALIEITNLIDEYQDAELICKMLVAFGYSYTGGSSSANKKGEKDETTNS